MPANDNPEIPRRKALLKTASLGGAVVGFSTKGLADDEEENSGDGHPPEFQSPDRPYNKPIAPDSWLTDNWKYDIPQRVLDDVDISIREYKTEEPIEGVPARAINPKAVGTFEQRLPASSMSGVEYTATILKASESGFTLKIEAGITADLVQGVANVGLSIDFNGFVFEFLSLGVSRGANERLCVSPNPPKAIPLTIDACPLIRLKNNNKLKFGGSVGFCVGIECPLPVRCEVCRGAGINATVDLDRVL